MGSSVLSLVDLLCRPTLLLPPHTQSKHYVEIKLDSLERLRSALSLYEKNGFVRCEKYVECPEKDHVCLALQLATEATG